MGELIFLIVIINFIVKAVKKANEEQKANQKHSQVNYQMPRQNVRTTPAREQLRSQTDQLAQVAKANLEKARRKAQEKLQEFERELEMEDSDSSYQQMDIQSVIKEKEARSAMQQIHKGRVEARSTTILDRAKANAEEDKEDITLNTMEAEHNHSERVSAAVHHHPEDVIPESMLGSVEDLMVKGYDGNLCFERDFVGEAMDMIARFTVPSDIPDFNKDDEVA